MGRPMEAPTVETAELGEKHSLGDRLRGSRTSRDPLVDYTGSRMGGLLMGNAARQGSEGGWQMDFVTGVIGGLLTLGVIFGVMVLLAGLFMVIFSIATGIDRRIQE